MAGTAETPQVEARIERMAQALAQGFPSFMAYYVAYIKQDVKEAAALGPEQRIKYASKASHALRRHPVIKDRVQQILAALRETQLGEAAMIRDRVRAMAIKLEMDGRTAQALRAYGLLIRLHTGEEMVKGDTEALKEYLRTVKSQGNNMSPENTDGSTA